MKRQWLGKRPCSSVVWIFQPGLTWLNWSKLSCACFPRHRVDALYCQARLSLKFVIVFVCYCIAVFRLNSRSCPCSILFSVPLVQTRDCIRVPYHFPHLWFKFAFVSVLRIVFPIDLIRNPVRALYCFPRVVDKGFH